MFEKLTECEELVMKVLWHAGEELGLTEITRRANDKYHKEWAPQTVSTFLARMVQKGYLKSYRRGRIFLYQILVPMEEYREQITKEFIECWYHGSSDAVDIRIALEAYGTIQKYCKSRECNCSGCLFEMEQACDDDISCVFIHPYTPEDFLELDLD